MQPSTTSIDVLIVDDDRAIQRMIADALTKHGFTVAVERDGDWAIKTFEKKRFDIVILDLLLPAMDGYEVARRLRAMPGGDELPIIMVSGVYKTPEQKKEALENYGAIAFLEKPLKLTSLYTVLRELLGDRFPAPRIVSRPTEPNANVPEPLADRQTTDEITHVEKEAGDVGGAASLQGGLEEKTFAEVLAEVHRWKATGALLLKREKVKKIVYFRNGVPVSVKSNLLSECLGRIMVKERMISEADCEESTKRMKASNRQQGTVLIEMGCISPQNLVHALTVQLEVKLFDLFAWENGDYQFNPKVAPPSDPVSLERSTASLIYDGIRRSFDEPRLERVLGDIRSLFIHPTENPYFAFQDAGLSDEENALLMAADGHKTVGTLQALDLLPEVETKRFLYAMKIAHLIELKSQPAQGKPKPSLLKMTADENSGTSGATPTKRAPPPVPTRTPSMEARIQQTSAPAPVVAPAPATRMPSVFDGAMPRLADIPEPEAPEPALVAFSMPARPRGGSLLPELDGGGKLSGEESLIRDRLLRKVDELRRRDYFQVLGASQTSSREEIKRFYFALAKEYHPDKHFGSSSAEIRQLAGQIYGMISTAHDTLTDPEERQRYLKELSQGMKREIGGEVGKILAAEGKFQRGEELLRQHQFREAHRLFSEAVQLYGEEGEFHAYLGWSLFQTAPNDPQTVEQALQSLESAVRLNPKVDKSYLFTGYIYKTTGRPDKAEKQFEKAIQCNPDCTEALRELRILGKGRRP